MDEFSTANINSKWLDNIYENLKNLEKMERIAYEGCGSILDYIVMTPQQRKIVIGETQYKNLRFIVTEFRLLLVDLCPAVDEKKINGFFKKLKVIENVINNRKMFVKEMYDSNSELTSTTTTQFFMDTLNYLSELRVEIIKTMGHILFMREDD